MNIIVCPECRVGKHGNCTGWIFDHRDQEAPCPCVCNEGLS